MDDLVERLRDAGYVLVSPGFRKLAHEAAARIEYLEKRLEIVPGLSETADGISCRDETIKLQDARIQALETSLAEAEGRVIAEVVAWLNNASIWLNGGECCGQKCSDGVCCAPACIWGDELKLLHSVATALETGEWKK